MRKATRNIQIIDGAINCTYDLFGASESDFRLIFPEPGQDVEFAEDFYLRLGRIRAEKVTKRLFSNPLDKKLVVGIHGTLFYQLERKKEYYPTKRECEMAPGSRPANSPMTTQKSTNKFYKVS